MVTTTDMQLNIHVPKDREDVVRALEAEVIASGRPKNQIVLDALAAYLQRRKRRRKVPELPVWHLGVMGPLHRADIYEERLNAKFGPPIR
jgi:hypothetical protein